MLPAPVFNNINSFKFRSYRILKGLNSKQRKKVHRSEAINKKKETDDIQSHKHKDRQKKRERLLYLKI